MWGGKKLNLNSAVTYMGMGRSWGMKHQWGHRQWPCPPLKDATRPWVCAPPRKLLGLLLLQCWNLQSTLRNRGRMSTVAGAHTVSSVCLQTLPFLLFAYRCIVKNTIVQFISVFLNFMSCSTHENKQARSLRKCEDRRKNPENYIRKNTVSSFQDEQRCSGQASL